MRTSTSFIVLLAILVSGTASTPRRAEAQETIVIEGGMAGDASVAPGGCGCRDVQSPPWHGSVGCDPCGPSCPPPTMFHADPCRQLWLKHNARQHGCVLPPCFPRMHGLMADGFMPTPRPIVMPRCPRCGAHIEQGF